MDYGSFVFYSKPSQVKLKNIARSGRAFFEATEDKEQVTIFTGYADLVDRSTISQNILDLYAEKYAQGMINIELPRPQHEAAYTEVIRVSTEKLRGW